MKFIEVILFVKIYEVIVKVCKFFCFRGIVFIDCFLFDRNLVWELFFFIGRVLKLLLGVNDF